jgi:uncharacterized protein YdeI (YjbR/CyaY-like superfamily)
MMESVAMKPGADEPILEFAGPKAFEEWLAANHDTSGPVWLKYAKKGMPTRTVTYVEALQVALCHGWIDGQSRGLDEQFYLQRWTRRGPKSKWSQINTDHIARLTAEGRMGPGGIAAVEAAKADGRWEAAYEPQSRAVPSEDFQQALDANPKAKEFFQTLKGPRRYAFLYRLTNVKRPEARATRIAQYIELLEAGQTLVD